MGKMAHNKNSSSREDRGWLQSAIIAILLLIILWGLGNYYGWWDSDGQIGTPSATNTTGTTGATGTTGVNGSAGTDGSENDNNNNNTPSSPIQSFFVTVDSGDTKAEVTAQAGRLSKSCTVTVNSAVVAGKTEVCAYADGSKIVTVTYLNDRVLTVTRSGF